MIRSDQFLTKLGDRGERNLLRLWIEETSFNRLARAGFSAGTGFSAEPRMGPGFILRPSPLGSCHVSARGKARKDSILSYEFGRSRFNVPTTDVRVRISCSAIFIVPALRAFCAAKPQIDVWTIDGDSLATPSGMFSIRTEHPLALPQTAARIEATLTESNLVYATEIIQAAKPGAVLLKGEPLFVGIAGQFLAAAGYGAGETLGEWRR